MSEILEFLNGQEKTIKDVVDASGSDSDKKYLSGYMKGALQVLSYAMGYANERTIEGRRLGYEFSSLIGWYKQGDESCTPVEVKSDYVKFD